MKSLLFFLFSIAALPAFSQAPTLEKIWESEPIAVPESVLPQKDFLFVTLIDGAGWNADGKGGVARLTPDGKIIDTSWITGLHAPKGMARVGDKLYVADIKDVVVIDIKKGVIQKKIRIDSAQALNDVTADAKGVVYVSDSRRGDIWKIKNDAAELYLDKLGNTNGLKVVGGKLYIGAGKSFVRASGKKITNIAEVSQPIDGIEPVGNGDFILTSWGGWIYYVKADGSVETLLDTSAEKKNTADIGYDAAKRILYVPTFNGKTVVAYKVR